MTHTPLLAGHQISSEWFTPVDIIKKLEYTLGDYYDPCPIHGTGGLESPWDYPMIYVNPPSPAAPWASKALEVHKLCYNSIILACFSNDLLWQLQELMDYPVCYPRKRIKWVDGRSHVPLTAKALKGENEAVKEAVMVSGRFYVPNPDYLKTSKNPSKYNAFVCISKNPGVIKSFTESFKDLGDVRQSYTL
jgi:hypothetical protein